MSPLTLRRYRADRLLREEFQGLRVRVLGVVRRRLRSRGVDLNDSDLEACYAIAWQGLHAAVLDGQQIESTVGWLVLATFRRALDEHRAGCARRGGRLDESEADLDACASARGRDLAGDLDDRIRLGRLFEGLSGRLNSRERQAAALCYLQGLTRSEAAVRMGLSEGRMRKLMEGRGAGDPGVSGKLGALAETIDAGGWCESQGSLMRALAYGILDADGERYRLALMHHGNCPACRAYVASLRGLAVVLPPALLPWGPLAALLGRSGPALAPGHGVTGGQASRLVVAARQGAAGRAGGAGYGVGGVGAVGTSGAAGGGWLLTGGPLGAKLAVGCLLALGVGGGCLAIGGHTGGRGGHASSPIRAPHRLRASSASRSVAVREAVPPAAPAHQGPNAALPLPQAARASREFGPEQALAQANGEQAPDPAPKAARAATATAARYSATRASSPAVGSGAARSTTPSSSAEREFAPG